MRRRDVDAASARGPRAIGWVKGYAERHTVKSASFSNVGGNAIEKQTTNGKSVIRRLLKSVGQLLPHHQALAATQIKKRATDSTDNTDEIQRRTTSQRSEFFHLCHVVRQAKRD